MRKYVKLVLHHFQQGSLELNKQVHDGIPGIRHFGRTLCQRSVRTVCKKRITCIHRKPLRLIKGSIVN